jgi:hypothetical protein
MKGSAAFFSLGLATACAADTSDTLEQNGSELRIEVIPTEVFGFSGFGSSGSLILRLFDEREQKSAGDHYHVSVSGRDSVIFTIEAPKGAPKRVLVVVTARDGTPGDEDAPALAQTKALVEFVPGQRAQLVLALDCRGSCGEGETCDAANGHADTCVPVPEREAVVLER